MGSLLRCSWGDASFVLLLSVACIGYRAIPPFLAHTGCQLPSLAFGLVSDERRIINRASNATQRSGKGWWLIFAIAICTAVSPSAYFDCSNEVRGGSISPASEILSTPMIAIWLGIKIP